MPKGIYIPADDSAPLEVRDFAGLVDYQAAVEGWIEPVDIDELSVTSLSLKSRSRISCSSVDLST